jgi:thiamine biosynthesis lipoprotein
MMTNTTYQPEWQWVGYAFKAMNTTVQTWLYSQTDSDVLVETQRLFNSFEKCLSRFNPNSELSRLNANPQESFQASPLLLDAVEAALYGAEISGGLYDPTILPHLEKAGYDRSFELVANPCSGHNTNMQADLTLTRPSVTFRSIHLNRANREIYKPVGVRLDLGGMGKGWSVDRAADRLQGLGPFLINAGGDIFAYQSPPGCRGWVVDLVHPWQPGAFIAQVHLHHKALATSTIAKRRWQQAGHLRHHLIDPGTGQPAQTDAVSVTVVTDRTVLAEIYAKAALILGTEQGLAYLESLPGVEGLIYTATDEVFYTPGMAELLSRLDPTGYKEELKN